MSSDDNLKMGKLYMHTSETEMQAFLDGKLKAHLEDIDEGNKNHHLMKAWEDADIAAEVFTELHKKAANKKIFRELIKRTGNDTLITTLLNNYDGQGYKAVQYIRSCFGAGDDDTLESEAAEGYRKVHQVPDINYSAEDFAKQCVKLDQHRAALRYTDLEVSDAAHAKNLKDMIGRISDKHLYEVRHVFGGIEPTKQKIPGVVQPALEGVLRKMSKHVQETNKANEELMAALKLQQAEIAALKAQVQSQTDTARVAALRRDPRTKCDECGIAHSGKCFSAMRARGEAVPGWDNLPQAQRDRIDTRAAEIKAKGPYNLRKDKPRVAIVRPPPDDTKQPGCMATPVVAHDTLTSVMVDSQAGVGFHYHFISDHVSDLRLFTNINRDAAVVKVGGAVKHGDVTESQGLGTCSLRLVSPVTGAVSDLTLTDCLYTPGLDFNLFNVWHSSEKHGTKFCVEQGRGVLQFADGSRYDLFPELDMKVVAPAQSANTARVAAVDASVITRGRHGAEHIEFKPLPVHEQVVLDLTSQRLNDPAPDRLKTMSKVMDNVPAVAQKANMNNTASDARLVANAPKFPAPASSKRHATQYGELTQIDGWDAQVTSVLGNKQMFACYDAASTDFTLYPCKTKAQFPVMADRYFLSLKLLPHSADAGTLFSDNEQIMIGQGMANVAQKHNRVPNQSLEYRQTGNAGAESVFRIVPNEMRKVYARTGVPEEFWDLVALEAERLLRIGENSDRSDDDADDPNSNFEHDTGTGTQKGPNRDTDK